MVACEICKAFGEEKIICSYGSMKKRCRFGKTALGRTDAVILSFCKRKQGGRGRITDMSRSGMKKSLYRKVTVYILIIALAGSTLLILNNIYTMSVTRKQVVQGYQSSLDLYMNEVNEELDSLSVYLHMMLETKDVRQYLFLDTYDYFSGTRIQENLSNTLLLESYVSGLWLYSTAYEREIVVRSSERSSYTEKDTLMELVYDSGKWNSYENGKWQLIRAEGTSYLFYLYYEKDYCTGAWCSLDTIKDRAEALFGDAAEVSVSTELPKAGSIKKIRLYSSFRALEDCVLILSLKNFVKVYVNRFLISLLLSSCALIALMGILVRNMGSYLMKPVQEITDTIGRIGEGKLDERVDTKDYVREFCQIGENLNQMTASISDLKIAVYEEELKKRDAIFQFRNSQIKPHFMLNVINTIYGMARMGEDGMIMKICRYLSDYMRYVFTEKEMVCTLEEEIRHIQEYICLQKMRFMDQIECTLDLEPQIGACKIPTMAVQTLVENSFKHGMGGAEKFLLRLEGYAIPLENKAVLRIQDNGEGFPEEIQKEINDGAYEKSGNTGGIGLRNSILRFKELYGTDFQIEVSRKKEYTVVELSFPMEVERK